MRSACCGCSVYGNAYDFLRSLRTSDRCHLAWQSAPPKAAAIVEQFKIRLSRPSPMGKVAALVLTEEEKTQDFPPSPLVLLPPIPGAFPLPPTFVGTFPSGKVFGCPKRRTHNQNHPTFDHKLSWLFFKCQRFRRSACSTHESVETVCLPHATDGPKSRKLHYGEYVGPTHVSPPNPRIKSQNPKGGFGALWRVFLRYLSSRKERYRHRRS